MSLIKYTKLFILSLALVTIASCDKDDSVVLSDPFVVAFESQSANLSELGSSTSIALVYSATASETGSFTITTNSSNAVYGVDYTTTPQAVNGEISFDIDSGTSGTNLTFNKINSNLDETTEITLTITEIDYEPSQIQGNTQFVLNNSASLGRAMQPELGGPNEQNQVYIDLSSEKNTLTQRDSWDLAFYGNDTFRVGINGSIYMATKALDATDIDAITEADVAGIQAEVAVGTFDEANTEYVDNPNGDIQDTAIDAISSNDSDNKVYLVNLGFEVGTEIPAPGSAAVSGDPRGWKKIRILRSGNDYVLQYADLNDTTHQTVTIPQSKTHNATFFSFNSNSTVAVQPEADKWDLVFTVFTNVLEGNGSYGFSDGVLHNRVNGVSSYQFDTTAQTNYDNFEFSNVDETAFLDDQRAIGSNWRDVFEGTQFEDRFYILKDANNNYYKLKFLALTSDDGVRGFPEFEYQLLNQ